MSTTNTPRAVPPALRIPSFLYAGEKLDNPKEGRIEDEDEDVIMSSIDCNGEPAKCVGNDLFVVFYSGGKDSLLALRAIIKRRKDENNANSSTDPILNNVVLLTTYDAANDLTTNKISLDTIRKQAQTLKIPLVAVPLYHGSSDRYSKRIKMGLDLIHRRIFNKTSEVIESTNNNAEDMTPKIETTLVFGDLHIEHLRLWRDRELKSGLPPYNLDYPLWKVAYKDLYDELEKSAVPCVISSIDYTAIKTSSNDSENYYDDFGDDDEDDDTAVVVNRDGNNKDEQAKVQQENKIDYGIAIGDLFDRKLFDKLMAEDSIIDAFGENGEFDTIVEVWETDRKTALGLI